MIRVFVAMFVVLNALPLLPVVASMMAGRDHPDQRRLLNQAMLAGAGVAVAMVLLGPKLFDYIGITVPDLRVGGGIVLLVFATHDLLFSLDRDRRRAQSHDIGVVPLGIPILMGPASLTTLIVLADPRAYGAIPVLIALAMNLAINWLLVQNASRVLGVLGTSFSKALGKVYSLLLAAIAVSMVRIGIHDAIETFTRS